ncbi:MAG: hypothetical protein ACI9OJ_004961, partial [Myxococcota bacterium]
AGTDDTAQTRLIMRRFITAFFNKTFEGGADDWLTGEKAQLLVDGGLITLNSK